MPSIRVEPSGVVLDAESGSTIMGAAQANGYYWPTICGGLGTCHTCFVRVISGAEQLSAVEPWEQEGLATFPGAAVRAGTVRLACQARPEGDVVVHKAGVRTIN